MRRGSASPLIKSPTTVASPAPGPVVSPMPQHPGGIARNVSINARLGGQMKFRSLTGAESMRGGTTPREGGSGTPREGANPGTQPPAQPFPPPSITTSQVPASALGSGSGSTPPSPLPSRAMPISIPPSAGTANNRFSAQPGPSFPMPIRSNLANMSTSPQLSKSPIFSSPLSEKLASSGNATPPISIQTPATPANAQSIAGSPPTPHLIRSDGGLSASTGNFFIQETST